MSKRRGRPPVARIRRYRESIAQCHAVTDVTAISRAVMTDDKLIPKEREMLLSICWSRRNDLIIAANPRSHAAQIGGKQFNIKRKAAQRA